LHGAARPGDARGPVAALLNERPFIVNEASFSA
jgi:hypothetical protein